MEKRKKLRRKVVATPFERFIEWTKEFSPWGFSGLPMYDVIAFVWKETMKDNIMMRANSVSFSLFLSLFPAIIFLFTLLPLIPGVQDYSNMISDNLAQVLPTSAHTYIFNIINDLTSIKRDGLLSLGAFLALWFSSNGMLNLMSGFDKAYNDTFRDRPWFSDRMVAISLTIIISILLILSLIAVVIESKALGYLSGHYHIPQLVLFLISFFNKIFAVFVVYTAISLIYRYGPAMYRRIPFINIGSVVATIFSILTSIIFSEFINNFNRFNEVYGSIGALMVTMIWIQLNVLIILIGFELNASVAIHKTAIRKSKNRG
jgi:membrane protein